MSDRCGVLVIASKKNEWALPWWFANYLCKNTLPVTFIDAGLSSSGLAFCRRCASVIPARQEYLKNKEALQAHALKTSSYERSLLIGIHIHIRSDVSSILDYFQDANTLLFSYDNKGKKSFSTDLIACCSDHPFLDTWLNASLAKKPSSLIRAIESFQESTLVLPQEYNWPVVGKEENLFAFNFALPENKMKTTLPNLIRYVNNFIGVNLSLPKKEVKKLAVSS